MHHSLVHCVLSDTFSEALQNCRNQTLDLVTNLSIDSLNTQAHPDFSPIGWHLGHIAYTESLWVIEYLAGAPRPFLEWDQLFAADGLPKVERQNLPILETLLDYLAIVREYTLRYLEQNVSSQNERLWHWLTQHEGQHAETMTMVLAMQQVQRKETPLSRLFPKSEILQSEVSQSVSVGEMLLMASGEFYQGCNVPDAIDNERPKHAVWTPAYWIDREPVTSAQYQHFIEAGGYQTERWWSPAGWQWQQQRQLDAPLYKLHSGNFPVCGVSWYEADAYARFVGKRLPTESEWEKAVGIDERCQLTTGSVWEWTDSWFTGYSGFFPFPYEGYSQTYFDGHHRVLKGSSWATSKRVRRPSFRNWYHPHRREMFAGFRCAKDA